ncbi:LuxR C-terminal-related transcriptional regulator [Tsukamurella pseudospumae]|nr:LuxR C-terminal-related transcriptional regulator [Tsukamurella pseudospumae]
MDAGESAIVGRGVETSEAMLAVSGANGGALIVGEPGTGKTVLARTVARRFAPSVDARWVAGTESTRAIPLGALGHLVAVRAEMDPIGLLAAAHRSLADEAHRLLVVDDAHLLDALTAIVVQQYVLARRGPVIVTARAGEQLPDPIARLWKDGHLRRITLQRFDRDQSEELVCALLGGRVEPEAVEALHRYAQGVPLIVSNLVRVCMDTGAVVAHHGTWRLDGALEMGSDLAELFAQRLTGLSAEASDTLAMIALAEELALDAVVAAGGTAAMAELESRRLVIIDSAGSGHVVRVEHPLLGDVVRARTGVTRARSLRGRLAEQLGRRGPGGAAPDARTLVRAARLRIQSDLPVDLEQVCTAAGRATAMAALEVGEELARWAVANGGGVSAALVLGDALTWQGRGGDVEALMAPYVEQDLGELLAIRVAVLRVVSLYWNEARPDSALKVLDGARSIATLPPVLDVIEGIEAQMRFFLGDGSSLAEAAPRLLAAPNGLPEAAVSLAGTAAIYFGLAGESASLRAVVKRGEGFAAQSATGLVQFNIAVGQVFGDVLEGSLDEADTVIARWRIRAGGEPSAEAIVDMLEGRVSLARGELDDAVRLLRMSLAQPVHSGWHLLAAHILASAEFERGDAEAAGAACELVEAAVLPNLVCYQPSLELTRAFVAAARGNITGARDVAMRAAAVYRSQQSYAGEVLALHLAVRLGDRNLADRLAALDRRLRSRYSGAVLLHARGLAGHASSRLRDAADAFETLGLLCAAADAAAHAVMESDAPEADSHRARLNRLVAATGQSTPAVRAARRTLTLTTREEDVTALVVAGLSNKDIARELGVSVRTVEGHLYRIFAKAGVSDRSALRTFL